MRYKAVQFYAWCDLCNEQYLATDTLATTSAKFTKELRSEGWSVGKQIVCPECRSAE